MRLTSIDYESYLISEEMIIPKPVCLSYCDSWDKDNFTVLVGMESMEKYLHSLLSDKKTLIIAHNALFEILVTYEYFPKLRTLLWDALERGAFYCTQLQQQLIDNISKKGLPVHSLSALLKHYFKIDVTATKYGDDAWRLRYSELEDVPLEDWPQEAIDYSGMDSVYALKVYVKQQEKGSHLKQIEHLKASAALNLMGARGMLISESKVKVLEDEIEATLKPSYDYLIQEEFLKYTEKTGKYSKSLKKLRERISKNFKTVAKTAKGSVKTSNSDLERYLLEQPDDKVIACFAFIAKYEKIKTSFIARLKQANPYIYTSYNPIVRSGRTSSRASKQYPSLNIQQIPRSL